MVSIGEIVADRYRIDRVIGKGGMGIVVAATHVHLGQRVALKFLFPEMAAKPDIVERFLREARASAQLRGDHVCRVFDVGRLETGMPYFVMELLEGHDLASQLTQHGPLPVPTLVDYVLQACLGLAEAHGSQIVHRDLKPANLFLTLRPDGTSLVKIVDFGIAKGADPVDFRLTQSNAVLGSPGYMSPEQLRSVRTADARSDIWALGVILYELSSGAPPFKADSLTDFAVRIAMDPTPALRVPGLPAGFARVVYRCLEKDPARRFQNVAELARALAPFGGPTARERSAGVARALSVSSAGPAVAADIAPDMAPTKPGSATQVSRGLRWAMMLVAALAAAAIVVVIELNHPPRQALPTSAAVTPVAAPAPTPAPPPLDAAATAPLPLAQDLTSGPVVPPPDAAASPDAILPAPAPDKPAVRKITPSRSRSRPEAGDDVGSSRL